ncbi:MAG TPA: hypothetical protein VMU39_11690 [Solirubrobacteraceae bacterium]|nr:hypothetical protein [Solirubrobacteraceae bacterium]
MPMIVRGDPRALIRRLGRVALMPGAALIVHQLRYTLAFGAHAQLELARQGHAYLHSVVPWIVVLIGVAVGAFLWALGRALAGQRTLPRYTLSLAGLWVVCSGCLLGIYVVQELLEGLLATGHPLGLAGTFGYGGWWAIPAAACVGLVLATIFHGARWVLDEVAQRHRSAPAQRVPRRPPPPRWRDATLPRLAPFAEGWSGRGPPR